MADRAMMGLMGLVLIVGLSAGQPAISAEKIGEVADEGPEVDRVRGLVNKLAPPYVSREQLRVYFFSDHSLASVRKPNLEREIANNYR